VSSDTSFAAVLAGLLLALVAAGSADAAPPCPQQVLLDWSDNGRIDHLYRLSCYVQALDDLPPDIRDYTDAADVIERALQSAVRRDPVAAETQPAEPSVSSRTVVALALAGASVVLAVAAVIAYATRRGGSGRSGTRR
jgi:hypothetical protein